MKRDNIKCLMTVPANDINFKCALEYATLDELVTAEENLDTQAKVGFRVKGKLLAVRREIKRRGKADADGERANGGGWSFDNGQK